MESKRRREIEIPQLLRRALELARELLVPTLILVLGVHFPVRVLVHLLVSRSGLKPYLPHPAVGPLLASLLLLASFLFMEGTLVAYSLGRARYRSFLAAAGLAARRLPRLAAARLLYMTLASLGTVLLLVPGVVAGVGLALHSWAVMELAGSARASLGASWAAVRPMFPRAAALVLTGLLASAAWLGAGFVLAGALLPASRTVLPTVLVGPLLLALAEAGILPWVAATGALRNAFAASGSWPIASNGD